MLSDIDSETIRRYGILNEQATDDGGFLAGIPYPGVYVTDEQGVVVAKFFHDTYKKRDSPEILIDAALGRPVISEDAPSQQGSDDGPARWLGPGKSRALGRLGAPFRALGRLPGSKGLKYLGSWCPGLVTGSADRYSLRPYPEVPRTMSLRSSKR